MTIYFYSQTDDYAAFSNFAPYGVALQDGWWPTVEHFFQAQKFDDPAYRERIRLADRPKQAKTLGMTRALSIRPDWDAVKDGIMYLAVRTKFETHPVPRALLLGTGAEEIVESAPMDAYWGCGPDGMGLNRLGRILMRVRDEIAARG
jgi:N-glycosidase YbiA